MTPQQLAILLQRPAESLNVEVKTWLDLSADHAIAKLVKGLFGLRNRNGGSFIIGFDDTSLQPDLYVSQVEVSTAYHSDRVQDLVSRFANTPFEVAVNFGSLEGVDYPVITVPAGVRVPVVVKRDLFAPDDPKRQKKLLAEGDVYFRTLGSNGRVSSSVMRPGDWSDLLDICFDNREADIGRFLRRHMGQEYLTLLLGQPDSSQDLERRCDTVMREGQEAAMAAFTAAAIASPNADRPLWLPTNPMMLAVALCLEPPHDDELPTADFLAKLYGANPNYTSRATWRDTRGSLNRDARPVIQQNAWRTVDVSFNQDFPSCQFDSMSPRGDFFSQKIMQDDLLNIMTAPGTQLDVALMMLRVTEVFAVGLALAKAVGWAPTDSAGFRFRWLGLTGRSLAAWAKPFEWDTGAYGKAHDPSADSFVLVPLDTPVNALEPYVSKAVGPMFTKFDGYMPTPELVAHFVKRLSDRRI